MNKVICNDPPSKGREIQIGDLIRLEPPFDSIYIMARVGMSELSMIGLDTGNRFNCDPLPETGKTPHQVFTSALGTYKWSFVNSVTITKE